MTRYKFPLFSLRTEHSPLVNALGAEETNSVLSRHDAVDAVIDFANGDITPLPLMQQQVHDRAHKSIESQCRFVRDRYGWLNKIIREHGIDEAVFKEYTSIDKPTGSREVSVEDSVVRYLETVVKEKRLPSKEDLDRDQQADLKAIHDRQVPYMERELGSVVEDVAELRRDAQHVLNLAVQSSDELLTYVSELTSDQRSEINIAPVLVKKGTKWIPDWQLSGPSDHPHPWIYFAAFALSEDMIKQGRTNIHICKWDKCGRFFRTVVNGKRGKPATEYCPGTDHRERARPKSTERVDRYRKKKKAEAATKRARKHR